MRNKDSFTSSCLFFPEDSIHINEKDKTFKRMYWEIQFFHDKILGDLMTNYIKIWTSFFSAVLLAANVSQC